MRKAFMLCVLAAALTSCGIGRTEQTAAPPAASQTAEQTITKPISAATSATKEKNETSVSSIITKTSESKKTSRSTTKSVAQTVSETIKADTSHTTARSSVRHEPTTLTPKSVTDSRQTVTSASKARTAERAAATEKPKAVTTVKTTAKPEKSMDTKVTAKTKNTAKEEIIYVEIENVTSLETMTKELENSSTPPSYYERIGKELANDGTDYSKARAVYNWMIENGHGSCVYYSMETYFLCKGIRNGSDNHVPGNISLSFKNREGESILHRLDLAGICVSTGSACDSVNTQVSHVLSAIKLDECYAKGTIRISLGKENTKEEIIAIVTALRKILS